MRLIAILIATQACAANPTPTEPTAAAVRPEAPSEPAPDPGALFDALEQRMTDAERLRVVFAITSGGQVPSSFRGLLQIDENVRLQARGSFGDQPVEIDFSADKSGMRGTSGQAKFELPAPVDLRGALVIGMTRMGLLHNLAVLAGARPPDRADGSVREWVKVSELAFDDEALAFDIAVEGQPVGKATLTLADGLPRERRQTVQFDEGSMTVTEVYEQIEVVP